MSALSQLKGIFANLKALLDLLIQQAFQKKTRIVADRESPKKQPIDLQHPRLQPYMSALREPRSGRFIL